MFDQSASTVLWCIGPGRNDPLLDHLFGDRERRDEECRDTPHRAVVSSHELAEGCLVMFAQPIEQAGIRIGSLAVLWRR